MPGAAQLTASLAFPGRVVQPVMLGRLRPMIQSIAFLTYAVSNLKVARHFYEDILGLRLTHEAGGEWFEYDIGDTTFAISAADAKHPVPVRGAAMAFEVSDLDADVARLQKRGVKFRQEITETPLCRFAIVLDPDGSEVIIHKRKASA